jgi:hypothetical protein
VHQALERILSISLLNSAKAVFVPIYTSRRKYHQSNHLFLLTLDDPNRCWDGKNLDSPDHKSHMAYPTGNNCPSTHPVRVPQILYETAWDTTAFNNPADWPEDGSQPFVFSTGDS